MCYRTSSLNKNNQVPGKGIEQRSLSMDTQAVIAGTEVTSYHFNSIIGNSQVIAQAGELARRFALSPANILLIGETGTGKELFAQAIHHESRPAGPFVALNCAAIPNSLIESELFGYDNGAFTGASKKGSPGKIELAQGGTLLLDEIGDMPLEAQAVLLRVLENKQVMRVGGKKYRPVDFRLITSTNKDLQLAVKNGQFRQDLYYRLSVLTINIPPLRKRGSDICYLAELFVSKYCDHSKTKRPKISGAAKEKLIAYHWPGNVRQLENAMIYALNVMDSDIILPKHLPDEIIKEKAGLLSIEPPTLQQKAKLNNVLWIGELDNVVSIKEAERICIKNAMAKSGYNIALAADLLEVSKSTLYRKLKMLEKEE